MIEIYNEVVRDLLSSKGVDRKGLPIHERPGRGFQSEFLTISDLNCYVNDKKLICSFLCSSS